jgi:putative ABC transport system permease protein
MIPSPPKIFLRFFRWYAHPRVRDYIEGDLMEEYIARIRSAGKRSADWKFILEVLLLFRPGILRRFEFNPNPTPYGMYKSYLKIGWRNLLRTKGYSFINITGLSIGMTVSMFIGLWIYDELSFDKYHENYESIAQVCVCETNTSTFEVDCGQSVQLPVSLTLKNSYPQYFKHVLTAWWVGDFSLVRADKKLSRKGFFIEGGALEMLSLKMLKGSYSSLDNQNSIILSRSAAEAIFGAEDPMDKSLVIHGKMEAEVTGIYEDIPRNNRFSEVQFFAPWSLWMSANKWIQGKETDWDNRPFNVYVQLQPNVSMDEVNAAIKDLYPKHVPADFYKTMERFKLYPQAVPMNTWHLYSEFENGKPAKGRITYVWLFGIVGIFVLALACINFVNLSTARSEKRAREVGVRKVMGSARGQLISQFMTESFLVVFLAFGVSLILLVLLRPLFNELSDKAIPLPFNNAHFWVGAITFITVTGFIAGVYPAFYLSSFQPVHVLKGKLFSGRMTALPRKVMVVIQFTVSVVLFIGTMIVYQQIQFAQNRPIGYDRESLIYMNLNQSYWGRVESLQSELLRTGAVAATTTSSSPLTAIWNSTSGYSWAGKDPSFDAEFAICNVVTNFGKTVGWELAAGRDFSRELTTDSLEAIIVNEAAVKYMGLDNPVGQEFVDLNENGEKKWSRTIIGVVKDLVMESPYAPVRPTLYFYNLNALNVLTMRIDPSVSAAVALPKIEEVVNKVVPDAVFDYEFVDQDYARKFNQEQRVGELSAIFSVLAMIICCLGLFGLASFVAEQRTKEIGIRKVVGASVFSLWKMLSKDFVLLVTISCAIAVPIGYYLMNDWLDRFEYRTEISLWILLGTCIAAAAVTLITVSFQSIKAARANPVNSLRAE